MILQNDNIILREIDVKIRKYELFMDKISLMFQNKNKMQALKRALCKTLMIPRIKKYSESYFSSRINLLFNKIIL